MKNSTTPSATTPDSISSAPTAPSIPFTDVVNLGRKLVAELGLDSGVDTLSRWMAHYLAEKISQCETAQSAGRNELEKECFDLILKLWKHRECFQHRKPMQSFAPVFEMLRNLQKPTALHYFSDPHYLKNETDDSWVKLAHNIDCIARDLIRWCLAMSSHAIAESEQQWLSSPAPFYFDDADDIAAANFLVDNLKLFTNTNTELSSDEIHELGNMRKRFDAFMATSSQLSNQIDSLLDQALSNQDKI